VRAASSNGQHLLWAASAARAQTEDPSPTGKDLGPHLGQAGARRTIGLANALKSVRMPSTQFVRIGFYVGSATLRLRYRLFSLMRATIPPC
jgi:hypothetical protein